MKNLRLLMLFLLVLPFLGKAQDGGVVKWTFGIKKIAVDTFKFTAKAAVERDWHIYSQETGEGSSPTVFTFAENPLVKLEGKVIEQGKLIRKKNDVLDSEIRYYADSLVFIQIVRVIGSKPLELKGAIEFMACNDQMCLPPEEVKFRVELK